MLTLFKILPVGVESKNDMGALWTLCNILVKKVCAVQSPQFNTNMALRRTQKEPATESAI
jgi:hypothetical protein